MASPEEWKAVRHFSPKENWGDPNAIDPRLLYVLDDCRHDANSRCFISVGYVDSGHAKKSYHYRGKAADTIWPDWKLHPIDQFIHISRYDFKGIGYYPDWEYLGKKTGGWHLDVRPLAQEADGTLNYRESRWMGVKLGGKQVYLPLTFENILKYSGG